MFRFTCTENDYRCGRVYSHIAEQSADVYLDAFCVVGDGRFDFAKASQLPMIVANEHQELVNAKQLMKKEIAECRKLQMHYCEVGTHECFQ